MCTQLARVIFPFIALFLPLLFRVKDRIWSNWENKGLYQIKSETTSCVVQERDKCCQIMPAENIPLSFQKPSLLLCQNYLRFKLATRGLKEPPGK